MTSRPLDGKTALVTGASRGLGREIARALAGAGARLALIARDADLLASVADEIRGDAAVRAYPGDLSDVTVIDYIARKAAEELGPFDILVNNAAVQGPIGLFEEIDFFAWQETFRINLFAPARLCQLLLPAMRERGWGKIINLSGGGATSPRPHFTAYAAGKCALVRLSETLARELIGSGIDVNAVAPGAMNTRMLEEVIAAGPIAAAPEFEFAVKRSRDGGVSPTVGAELVVFLASSASDGITGRLISAVYDDWKSLPSLRSALADSDRFTLRRIT